MAFLDCTARPGLRNNDESTRRVLPLVSVGGRITSAAHAMVALSQIGDFGWWGSAEWERKGGTPAVVALPGRSRGLHRRRPIPVMRRRARPGSKSAIPSTSQASGECNAGKPRVARGAKGMQARVSTVCSLTRPGVRRSRERRIFSEWKDDWGVCEQAKAHAKT